jgi:hypothetical protein
MNILARKARTVVNHINHFRCQRTRPAANQWFARISRQVSVDRKGAILCEGLWDHPHHWLRLAMFRCALAPHYGSGLVGVYEQSSPNTVVESLRSLPLSGEEMIPSQVPPSYLEMAGERLAGVRTANDVLNLDIADGYPMHFFYDGVLKLELLGTIDGNTSGLKAHLARTLFYIDTYQDILERNDIRAVVVSHPTTNRFSTLVWAAIRRGIPVFVINYRNQHITLRKLTELSEIGNMPEDVPSIDDLNSLSPEQRGHLIEVGRDFLDGLHKGQQGEIAVTGAFGEGKAQYRNRADLARAAGGDPDKPNIVVLTSCWPDFPNAMGRSYFTDHVDWFERTHAVAREDTQYNWIFKPHPAEEMYGRKTSLRQLIDGRLGDGVYLWPEKATGIDVLDCADCAVTALGSVGFEYPALGARALVARETAYTDWGFSNFAGNADEYAQMLRRAAELPLPTPRMREDALIYMALRLTTPAHTQDGGYRYPWGRLSYKIWPDLPKFIEANLPEFDREISMIDRWLRSDSASYSVFKSINGSLW